MSSAVSARPPGGQHRDPGLAPTKDQPKTGALGLTSATMLVIGTVIGAGVFTMPAVLASAGTVSLLVLAVIAVGATVLAILFGQLTRRVPNSDGGLYAYAGYEFGDGTPGARAIRLTTPAELRARSFPAGSMGPKVEAACRFVEATGKMAAIGRLDAAAALLRREAGTIISP